MKDFRMFLLIERRDCCDIIYNAHLQQDEKLFSEQKKEKKKRKRQLLTLKKEKIRIIFLKLNVS